MGGGAVRLKVSVMVAAGPSAIQAAKQATKTIPIVMAGVAPVRWTVNCFRDRHGTLSEGGTEIAPPVSIVDPEGCVRSRVPRDRS